MKHFWETYKEILADLLLGFSGLFLIYVFLTIEVFGIYGAEANSIVRTAEVGLGVFFVFLGIERFIKDLRSAKK